MKKAAIITWCDNNGVTNYGQVLQCYAMQKICEKMGMKAEVLQYRKRTKKDWREEPYRSDLLNQIYEVIYKICVIEKNWNKRIARFRKFIRRYIHLSYPCYDIAGVEEKTSDCDVLLCGSDQIWNPNCIQSIYGLNFGQRNQLRIAFAPSGVALENAYSNEKYKELASYIGKMDMVSVREAKGAEILKKYSDKDIVDVLDPTFLLDVFDWEKVAVPRLIRESYLFCYTLGEFQCYKRLLKPLMQRYGALKVVYIPSNLIKSVDQKDPIFMAYESAGPAEFLSLIRYANMVCTDSFHGMALSINFNRQFCILGRVARNSASFASEDRQNNILEKVHLNDRKIGCVKDLDYLRDIDYSKVNVYLQKEVNRSWQFLEKAFDQMKE